MVQINFALREVNCKVVYYGPGMSGKTTNLEIVHKKAPESNKGELTSIATEGDRTLFFDFMPLDLGTIAGMRTRFQLYTVPGQVYYNSTRKLVLQGVDGIVFVADSQASKMEENLESLENLKNNLAEYGKDIREIALVIQYNKRDLPDALSVEEMEAKLNPWGVPTFEAVAITGEGVFPTLKALSGMVLETLNRDEKEQPAPAARTAAPEAAPAKASIATPSGRVFGGNGTIMTTPGVASGVIRRGASMAELNPPGGGTAATSAPAPGAPLQRPAGPPAGHGPRPTGGGGWNSNRKVEASPLQQSIRTTPSAASSATGNGPRQVQIQEHREFPWVAVGLGGLILAAVGVILWQTGLLATWIG